MSRQPIRIAVLALLLAGCTSFPAPAGTMVTADELAAIAGRVEIRRTTHGVPHILASDLEAAAFALAWVQLEDHGARIIEGINAARGRSALVAGRERVDADADARLRHARAVETWPLLHQDTRDVYDGFAAGLNWFIRQRQDGLPGWMRPDFTGPDVLARDIVSPGTGLMERFREQLLERGRGSRVLLAEDQNVGSNAWALAPSRTANGNAILLRNPHLSWTAGYYEAHVRVPGALDFYGDFRIGGPFTVIGGFNRDLGFATTNNASRSHEFYALRLDPANTGRYLFGGRSLPIERVTVEVPYRGFLGRRVAERERWLTHLGAVVHRDTAYVYILRMAADGDYRAGEQWLRMMQATSLAEWKEAMRIGARTTSNFTYADRAGHIFYVWMSGAPRLPHPPGGDTLAVLAADSSDLWTTRAPFDSLPQLLDPAGGYIHNENDSPHFTNLNAIMPDSFGFAVEEPRLRLRSQHALELLHNDRVFTLEDVVAAKHSMRMLLADRVKDPLLAAVRASSSDSTVLAAAWLLTQWDNTASADSRGALLFETWWDEYRRMMRGRDLHAREWSAAEPASTPRGLADPARAAEAFDHAVAAMLQQYGRVDVPWGEIHRVRRGNVDVAVGGCGGALGCFRVLNFATAPDGRRVVNGGDGWVIAIEFADTPRAYSVLAYGQSPDPDSPWHADQAALFADNRMKPVLWTEEDIARGTVLRYRPGAIR